MRLAHFDCFSGISGDMVLGALVDAGLDIDLLRSEIAKLRLPTDLRVERPSAADWVRRACRCASAEKRSHIPMSTTSTRMRTAAATATWQTSWSCWPRATSTRRSEAVPPGLSKTRRGGGAGSRCRRRGSPPARGRRFGRGRRRGRSGGRSAAAWSRRRAFVSAAVRHRARPVRPRQLPGAGPRGPGPVRRSARSAAGPDRYRSGARHPYGSGHHHHSCGFRRSPGLPPARSRLRRRGAGSALGPQRPAGAHRRAPDSAAGWTQPA